jgi:dihydrofolate reductase
MKLSIIAALGVNNEIGQGNALLCSLPADLKHFRQITSGHTVIMGRKTFESLPAGPLPNRTNIVISRNPELRIDGAAVCSSLDAALLQCLNRGEEEIFVIGGAQIYRQALPAADKLYLTRIHAVFPEADAFFPAIAGKEWREMGRETHPADEKHPYSFSFVVFER